MPIHNVYKSLSAEQKVHLFDAAANPALKVLLNNALQEVENEITDISYDGDQYRLAEKYTSLQRERRFIKELIEVLKTCVDTFSQQNQE